jgi:hypothetical protein
MSGVGGIGQTVPIRTTTGEPLPEHTPRQVGDGGATPPPQSFEAIPEGVPVLSPALIPFDMVGSIAEQFLAMKVKTDQERVNSDIGDIRDKGVQVQQKNKEISDKLLDAAEKMEKAKTTSLIMKIFGWIAVALSVVAAVVTGGALAMVAAGVGLVMATLNETGVMNKLMEAIAKDRMERLGESPSEAKRNAMIIMTVLTIAISVATIASGIASGTQAAANLGSKLAEAFPKLANVFGKIGGQLATSIQETIAKLLNVTTEAMQRVGTAAKIAGAVSTAGQAVTGIAAGAQRFQAAKQETESAELRAFLRRLQQQMEDEQESVAALVQSIQAQISKVVEMMAEHSETSSKVIGQMRPQTA